jgi:hypothetical protein
MRAWHFTADTLYYIHLVKMKFISCEVAALVSKYCGTTGCDGIHKELEKTESMLEDVGAKCAITSTGCNPCNQFACKWHVPREKQRF